MRRSLIMMFAAASAIAAVAAPAGITGTITTEAGDTNKGLIRWSARDKAYVITKGGVELQVKATDVAEIDIAKPAGWDQIVAQVEKGQGAAAVAPLYWGMPCPRPRYPVPRPPFFPSKDAVSPGFNASGGCARGMPVV